MKGGHVASTDFFVLKQCLSELFSFNQHHLINLMQKKSYSICSQVRWKYLQITVFLATRKQSNSFAIYYFWYFYLFLLEFNHFLSSSFIKKKERKKKWKKGRKFHICKQFWLPASWGCRIMHLESIYCLQAHYGEYFWNFTFKAIHLYKDV